MKQVKKEIEFLEFLNEEILMEKDTYSFIVKKSKKSDSSGNIDNKFIEKIESIIMDYNKFLNSIKQMLKNRKKQIKREDLLFRIASYYAIDVEKSTLSEISKHLIHGSEVVKNKISEKLNDNIDIGKTIKNLVNRLIEFQDKNNKELENYVTYK